MKKNSGLLKGVTSLAICGMIFGASGELVSAKEKPKAKNEIGEAVAAFYINDEGKRVDIPKEDLPELLDETAIYELPGDTKVQKEDSNGSGINIAGYVCEPGWVYAGSKGSGGFKNHKSGTRWANKGSKDLPYTSSTGSAFSISPELSVTGDVKWAIIDAKVGFKLSATWSWTKTESVTIAVPPNRMGWADFGSYRESWSGPYYYVNSSCTQSSKKTVKATGSKYKLNVARESAIPSGV